MRKVTTISVDQNIRRLLELEKSTMPEARTLEDVLRANIDFDRMQRKFSRLFQP